MIENLILGCACIGQICVAAKVLEDVVLRHCNVKFEKIRDMKEIARAIKIVRHKVEMNDTITLFLNVKTLEFWAELNNETPSENEIAIDYSFYIVNGEIPTEEQLEFIKAMVIKKYTLHKKLVAEHKSELCECGMFYR